MRAYNCASLSGTNIRAAWSCRMGSSRRLMVSITARLPRAPVDPPAASAVRGLDREHAVDHLAGKAQVIRRVAHLLELPAADVPGDLLVGGKQVDQRLAAG